MNINDINEEWVRQNIDIEERRGNIKSYINETSMDSLVGYGKDIISLDDFMEKINKFKGECEEIIKTRSAFRDLNCTLEYDIKREEYDADDITLICSVVYPENDTILIRRIIKSERAKIRRKKNQERRQEKAREMELAEYRRLRKKYGNIINNEPVS